MAFWGKKLLKSPFFHKINNKNSQEKVSKMSIGNSHGSTKTVFSFELTSTLETKEAQLFEEINKELETFLARENNNSDATDGVLDFLTTLPDSVQK